MFTLNRSYNQAYSNIIQLARFLCIKTNFVENLFELKKNSFSPQQSAEILETLNESSPEELSKYNIPLARIQKLINWKSQNGPFKNLNEVLKVIGFGESVLQQIGENISYHNNTEGIKTITVTSNKRIKHLVVPDISLKTLTSLQSAVAIHLEPTGIGWAKLEKQDNVLTEWTCESFSSLPMKMMPVDTFTLALNVLRKTPPGDVYIFEAQNGLGLQSQSKQAAMSTYNQKMELLSMFLALINTSVIHNPTLQRVSNQEPVREIINRVFFLKHNIPARLFRTLIGSEKVSAVTAIQGLLNHHPKVYESLPYTPIIFEDTLTRAFSNHIATNKELMAQALMLAVSFMDLYVRKNPISYEALNFNKLRKKKSS